MKLRMHLLIIFIFLFGGVNSCMQGMDDGHLTSFKLIELLDVEGLEHELSSMTNKDLRDGITRRTLLHAAVGSGSGEIVRRILDWGVDINAVDHEGLSALYYAANQQNNDLTSFLLDRGADIRGVNIHTGNTLLHLVARDGNYELARRLIDLNCPMQRNRAGETPLFRAVIRGNTALAALFLEHGATIDFELSGAQLKEMSTRMIRILIMYGFSFTDHIISARFVSSRQGIEKAAATGNMRDLTMWLSSQGRGPASAGNLENALAYAAGQGYSRCVAVLIDSKAPVGRALGVVQSILRRALSPAQRALYESIQLELIARPEWLIVTEPNATSYLSVLPLDLKRILLAHLG